MRLNDSSALLNTSFIQPTSQSDGQRDLTNQFRDNPLVLIVGIDSRRVTPGQLFVAIQGERFDGHAFIHDAVKNGAIGVVCLRAIPDLDIPQFVVSDTIQALADLATFHRRQITNTGIIALTGSNGKTTVKEMISSILPQPSFATSGNLNNHLGAPLSVLQLQPKHRYAVFELGANHQGEIAHTVSIVQPQVALINNIAPAHIGEFGSIDGVAQAKGEIYNGLIKKGIAIVNDDDAYAHFWDNALVDKEVIRFSAHHKATVYAQDVVFNEQGCAQFVLVVPEGSTRIQLTVPGAHNVSNALAAAACTSALGISLADIQIGLSQFSGVKGRMTFMPGKQHAVIIDDTYNANLRSVLTALDVLAKRDGCRIFVFGDMGELGPWSEQHHREVGLAARDLGIDKLMTCGIQSKVASQAFGAGAKHYTSQDDLVSDLKLDATTTVLVKGSRSSAMENIVHRLV